MQKGVPRKMEGGGEKKNKKTKQKEDMYNTPFTWKVERPKKKTMWLYVTTIWCLQSSNRLLIWNMTPEIRLRVYEFPIGV